MKILRAAGYTIVTLLLYLGIPLAGWGLRGLRDFFAVPQRAAYGAVVAILALAVGCHAIESPEGIRGGRGQRGKVVPRQTAVRVVAVMLLYAALFLLPLADRHGIGVMAASEVFRSLGLLLTSLGLGLIFWSGLALGRLYSPEVTVQEGHQLITTGLYRHVRHPRYLGAQLMAVGLPLVFRSWVGLAVGVLFMGLLLFRIRDEETFMHQEFGSEWEAYCKRSWRLVPFLY